jgi:CO/xanthine dehydrogenase FAD-binding subunit
VKSFEYFAPSSIGEAIALLAEKGDRARPLAGGTDLLVKMRNDLLAPDFLVDVKRIPELNQWLFSETDGLTIGAALPLCSIYEHLEVAATYPALIDAARMIGGIATQGRATLGGNLCNASPSGDTIPALIVLDGVCIIASSTGQRDLPVEAFCAEPGRTALKVGELLVSISLPIPKLHTGTMYLRFTPRSEMDITVVGVGASLTLDENYSTITDVRLALGGVAATPLHLEDIGKALAGRIPDEDTWTEAAALAKAAANPISDVRGEINQRQHLVEVLTRRALRGAFGRIQRGVNDYVKD